MSNSPGSDARLLPNSISKSANLTVPPRLLRMVLNPGRGVGDYQVDANVGCFPVNVLDGLRSLREWDGVEHKRRGLFRSAVVPLSQRLLGVHVHQNDL